MAQPQTSSSHYQFSEHFFIVASKHWKERHSFGWWHSFGWYKSSMVLKDLAKSGGFFLLGVPKYLLTAKFFIFPTRKDLVYHSWHVIQKQQKFTRSTGFFVINNWVTAGPRWNLGKSVRVFFQTRPGPRKTRPLVNVPREKIELHAWRK